MTTVTDVINGLTSSATTFIGTAAQATGDGIATALVPVTNAITTVSNNTIGALTTVTQTAADAIYKDDGVTKSGVAWEIQNNVVNFSNTLSGTINTTTSAVNDFTVETNKSMNTFSFVLIGGLAFLTAAILINGYFTKNVRTNTRSFQVNPVASAPSAPLN